MGEKPAWMHDGAQAALLAGYEDLEVVGESHYQHNLRRLTGYRPGLRTSAFARKSTPSWYPAPIRRTGANSTWTCFPALGVREDPRFGGLTTGATSATLLVMNEESSSDSGNKDSSSVNQGNPVNKDGSSWWKDNSTVIIGVLSVAVVAIRVLGASRGDPEIAFAILQAGAAGPVLIATLVSTLGLLAIPALAAFALYARRERSAHGKSTNYILLVSGSVAMFYLAFYMAPVGFLLLSIFIVISMVLLWLFRPEARASVFLRRQRDRLWGRWSHIKQALPDAGSRAQPDAGSRAQPDAGSRAQPDAGSHRDVTDGNAASDVAHRDTEKRARRIRKLLAWLFAKLRAPVEDAKSFVFLGICAYILIIFFYELVSPTPWLPVQSIVTKGQGTFTGYVLSQANGTTSILISNPEQVASFPSQSILPATMQCTLPYFLWEQATLAYLVEDTRHKLATYSPCPSGPYKAK